MISLMFPQGKEPQYNMLSEVTQHDLGLDTISHSLSQMEAERNMICRFMSHMTADPEVAQYRCDVFADILQFPDMRKKMSELLEHISFMKDYGSLRRDHDQNGIWDLMHRLDEIRDYISIIEALHSCLEEPQIHSEGLLALKNYAEKVYADAGYAELKKDIAALHADTSHVKSITVGINLNECLEAESIGLISVNTKTFTASNMFSNFAGFLSAGDELHEGTEWKENYKYNPVTAEDMSRITADKIALTGMLMKNPVLMGAARQHPLLNSTTASVRKEESGNEVPHYMERTMNRMLAGLVKKLRSTLSRHTAVSVYEMALLIPEFTYYVRWAEFIEKMQAKGMKFCKPQVLTDIAEKISENESGNRSNYRSNNRSDKGTGITPGRMHAKGFYNLRLAEGMEWKDIVVNDLDFDKDHMIYILTGANRGGKTTVTQAVGLLFLLAQGGISVPAESFSFTPADNIFTHFPADEDKTTDLGRLGEECRRFRDIYMQSTAQSLMLLNETFSTTSFEEGYYIAYDAVKALKRKDIRTIYNTHMHKLGYSVEEFNAADEYNIADEYNTADEDNTADVYSAADEMNAADESGTRSEAGPATLSGKVCSLISVTDSSSGTRSYRIKVAPPEGSSFARDIAEKYGVTYRMLTEHS